MKLIQLTWSNSMKWSKVSLDTSRQLIKYGIFICDLYSANCFVWGDLIVIELNWIEL